MAKFKKEILDQILADTDLFSLVAKEMGVKPISLPAIVYRNGNNLNQYGVVKIVADYLDMDPGNVVEDNKDTVAA